MRIGVDVGGTFTKAVACDPSSGEVLLRACVPTTHSSSLGVAQGVVEAIEEVVERARGARGTPIALVGHSTTQAVNALLEGDTHLVGVLGIGRRPDLRRARKRTAVGKVSLAPGRTLATVHEFVEADDGITRATIEQAMDRLIARGAEALCVSEAFGVDDPHAERLALAIAEERGVPACAGHELSGLYGLEMRTVTGALNAAILPTALATARVVEQTVARVSGGAPLLVMRGDGGACDLRSMRRHPLLTAFSGPAASVAGALRHLTLADAAIVEVGGTSTNVSVVRAGRPVLSYVRVLEHVTSVRSLDVRVVGVAGGSLLRVGRRFGRPRIEDVGPRSAHIAGLPYACFSSASDLEGVTAQLMTPREGDPPEYVALQDRNGRRFALTLTCAANALGEAREGTYARGNREAARLGFSALGRLLGRDGDALARGVLEVAARRVAAVISEALAANRLSAATIVGLGGGAGALVPSVAGSLGMEWRIPPEAEVISSVGDALSLVRVEVESSARRNDTQVLAAAHRKAEEAALQAGAAPASLQVETEALPERQAVRAVAVGSVALESEALPLEPQLDEESLRLAAKRELRDEVETIAFTGIYTVFGSGSRFAVLDARGSLALRTEGEVLLGSPEEVSACLGERIERSVRRFGPLTVGPAVRILRGGRLVDLTLLSDPKAALESARAECALAEGSVVAFLSRT